MTENEILERLADLIQRTFQDDTVDVSRETTALDVDGWDSLSHTVLILRVETTFGITIPVEQVVSLRNVGDLVEAIFKISLNDAR